MGITFKNQNMKFVQLLFIAAVRAQDDDEEKAADEFPCTNHNECNDKFDDIYAAWESSEFADDPSTEPKAGEMKCGNVNVTGTDEESGEDFDHTAKYCVTAGQCAGWEGEEEGMTIKILNCDMEAAATKFAAG